jgi:hypothetical protein
MNYRVKPPTASIRWVGLSLALLLSALARGKPQNSAPSISGSRNAGRPHANERPIPYQELVGAPPLRFQEPDAVAQIDLPIRPSAPTPLPPVKCTEPASVLDVLLNPGWRDLAKKPVKPEENNVKPEAASAQNSALPPILPDDGVQVRPEDFLPFFQFPGTGGDGRVSASVSEPTATKDSYGSSQ